MISTMFLAEVRIGFASESAILIMEYSELAHLHAVNIRHLGVCD